RLKIMGCGKSSSIGVHMAIGRPEIPVPIIVEISKTAGPAQIRDSACPQSCAEGSIFVESGLQLLEEREIVFRKRSCQEVQVAIVVIVASSHAHVSLSVAVSVQGHAAGEARLFESSVSQVQVEVVGAGIVCHKEVGSAVSIQVLK